MFGREVLVIDDSVHSGMLACRCISVFDVEILFLCISLVPGNMISGGQRSWTSCVC